MEKLKFKNDTYKSTADKPIFVKYNRSWLTKLCTHKIGKPTKLLSSLNQKPIDKTKTQPAKIKICSILLGN